MLHLALGVERIGRYNDRAGLQGSVERNGILGNVGKRNGYAVAALDAQTQQGKRKAICQRGELRIGYLCAIVNQSSVVRISFDCFIEQPGQGIIRDLQLSRDTRLIIVYPGPGSKHGGVKLRLDRKSTRLNSSHVKISYAVFCLK